MKHCGGLQHPDTGAVGFEDGFIYSAGERQIFTRLLRILPYFQQEFRLLISKYLLSFMINFRYNAWSDWLRERALSGYKARSVEFLRFFLRHFEEKRVSPYTSFVLSPLPVCFTTEQSTVEASLFVN